MKGCIQGTRRKRSEQMWRAEAKWRVKVVAVGGYIAVGWIDVLMINVCDRVG